MIFCCEKEIFLGAAFTVTLHLFVLLFDFAMMVALPIFLPLIFPNFVTETIFLFEDRKDIFEELFAFNWKVSPLPMVTLLVKENEVAA